MSEEIKSGKPWKNDSFHKTFEEADQVRDKLLSVWKDNDSHKGMQVKIKRMPSRDQFIVKVRLHPDFEPVKEKSKKNGKNRKRNKKDTGGGKFDSSASV